MQNSCALLTLLAVALASVRPPSRRTLRAGAARRDRARGRAAVRRSARRRRAKQTRPTNPPPAGRARRADARRRGGARARAQPRHRRRAAESADVRLLARRARRHLPADVRLELRPAQPDGVHAQPDGRRRHPRHRHAHRQQRRLAEREVGRRQLRGRRSTTTARSSRTCSPRATRRSTPTSPRPIVQPLLRNFRIDGTRAAAARSRRLNQEMSETTLRATIVRTRGERAQRVLGSRLRDPGGRSGRALARRWRPSSSRTTRRASRSARWRRSTSSRRRPKQATRRQTVAHDAGRTCAPRSSC